MANVTQTANAGAAQYATTPRTADNSSDNFANGSYSHRAVDFSATEKGELVSRLLYHERMIGLAMWRGCR